MPEQPPSPGTVAADVPPRATFGPHRNAGRFRDLLESAPDAIVVALKQLVRESRYVIDERAVAEAILMRSRPSHPAWTEVTGG